MKGPCREALSGPYFFFLPRLLPVTFLLCGSWLHMAHVTLEAKGMLRLGGEVGGADAASGLTEWLSARSPRSGTGDPPEMHSPQFFQTSGDTWHLLPPPSAARTWLPLDFSKGGGSATLNSQPDPPKAAAHCSFGHRAVRTGRVRNHHHPRSCVRLLCLRPRVNHTSLQTTRSQPLPTRAPHPGKCRGPTDKVCLTSPPFSALQYKSPFCFYLSLHHPSFQQTFVMCYC